MSPRSWKKSSSLGSSWKSTRWFGPPTTCTTTPAPSNTNLLPTGGLSRWLCASIQRAKLNGWRKLAIVIASSLFSPRVPADGAGQEIVAESGKGGALGVVLTVTVPAGGRFVKVGLIAHYLQLCRHLAGMAGMHAIVAPTRRDQDRRVGPARDRGVIGGNPGEKLPVGRVVWIAEFGNPARPGVQFRIAAHVDQRDRAEQRPEALRIAGQHIGNQDAAIRPAFSGDTAGSRHAAAHEVGGDSGEIVVAQPL